MTTPPKLLEYTALDYEGFRDLMISVKKKSLPDWPSESPSDFGIVLIEAMAYLGDLLAFYGDRLATESFLETATTRESVIRHARLLDYRPTGRSAAEATVEFTLQGDTGVVTIPAGTKVSTSSWDPVVMGLDPIIFEVVSGSEVDTAVSTVAPVLVRQGETVTGERVANSDGSVHQEYRLFRAPVIAGTVRVFVDEGAGPTEWTEFPRLIDAQSNQFAFETFESDGGVSVVFGDGVNGRTPSEGAEITVTYRVGGGEVGNVSPGTIVEQIDSVSGVLSLTNPEPATGGADEEPTDQIRRNAPRSITAAGRAVTLEDFSALALNVAGVAKARSESPAFNAVVVYIAPFGGGTSSDALKERVQEFFEPRMLVRTSLTVEDADFVPLGIDVRVVVQREYNRSAVQKRVEAALVDLLDFTNVDFAELVAISKVYNAINQVEGVRFATLERLARGGETGVDNIQLSPNEIPLVGELVVIAEEGILGS
jgi:uncharacterized phage protein gp47/JayE